MFIPCVYWSVYLNLNHINHSVPVIIVFGWLALTRFSRQFLVYSVTVKLLFGYHTISYTVIPDLSGGLLVSVHEMFFVLYNPTTNFKCIVFSRQLERLSCNTLEFKF